MSFPGATEEVQWGADYLYKVGGKTFVFSSMDNFSEIVLSVKSTPDAFAELVEQEGIIPAPYLARNKWVAVKRDSKIKIPELKKLIKISYELVFAKLPKKKRDEINKK